MLSTSFATAKEDSHNPAFQTIDKERHNNSDIHKIDSEFVFENEIFKELYFIGTNNNHNENTANCPYYNLIPSIITKEDTH